MASLYVRVKELQTQRKSLAEQTSRLIVTASKERRSLSNLEHAEWDRSHEQIDKLGNAIERLQQQAAIEAELGKVTDRRTAGREDTHYSGGSYHSSPGVAPGSMNRRALPKDHGGFQTRGADGRLLTGKEITGIINRDVSNFMDKLRVPGSGYYTSENRALGGTGTTGDYTIPQGFIYLLDVAMKWFGGILQAADYIDTTDGRLSPFPTVNDTANAGEITAENASVTITSNITNPADPLFGVQNFSAWMYDSGLVKIPIQLVQDSGFDIEGVLMDPTGGPGRGLLITRILRKLNTDCTNGLGSGSSQPLGFTQSATLGATGTSPTVISYADLLNLEYSVDKSYRQQPTCGWMFHEQTEKQLRLLADNNNRPLWIAGGVSEGIQNGVRDRLLGYPTFTNNDLPQLGSSNKPLYFGDWSKYKIRRVREMGVMKLVERFAEFLSVGMQAYQRFDGALVDSGSHPLRYFKCSAT